MREASQQDAGRVHHALGESAAISSRLQGWASRWEQQESQKQHKDQEKKR